MPSIKEDNYNFLKVYLFYISICKNYDLTKIIIIVAPSISHTATGRSQLIFTSVADPDLH